MSQRKDRDLAAFIAALSVAFAALSAVALLGAVTLLHPTRQPAGGAHTIALSTVATASSRTLFREVEYMIDSAPLEELLTAWDAEYMIDRNPSAARPC